jgi:hypothetical protein
MECTQNLSEEATSETSTWKPEKDTGIICDGLGDTSEMNVATQRSGTDLASPTKRLFRIHGASDVIAATQRLVSERILQ